MRQIFLDTETTGLSPEQGDRVVEIGCVEMEARQLTGRTLHLYLNPERKSSEEAVRVHGLTDEFLAGQRRFAEVAQEFLEFVRGAELIIHNAAFDVGFLNAELTRLRQPPLSTQVGAITDSLLMARELYPGKANSLDALCRRLEVDNSNRTFHGALLDAGLLAEVYIRMTRGQKSLVMEEEGESQVPAAGLLDTAEVDLSGFVLPVLEPDDLEREAHVAALKDLDKNGGVLAGWPIISA
ncbi:DNA polymerase III subunit epsilon [Ideonella livida]|uniref:DNA polymerase III subunit epsilon n=1 Tax=Ideonella livida TaxID=2707176 RepID=A0A7C9PGE7_9BURK|nr:DNA polymerase III subunit epsilon [Ideonella livida]NDY90770.1 DNA polymerase III subunit epsilon [Ideonella livida]